MNYTTLVIVLLSMVFCHIVDDFYMQGILAKLKQKEWWEQNAPEPLYRLDYIVALGVHGMSWSFMILVPFMAWAIANGNDTLGYFLMGAFKINAVIHAVTDHLKANKRKINLREDQLIHFAQIAVTFIVLSLRACEVI